MDALLAALAVPGPPQQLILGHLSLQERLYLSATCTALHAAGQRWHWEVPVVIGFRYNSRVWFRERNTDLAALNTWLQRHAGCDLHVELCGGSQVQPLLTALSTLPTGMVVKLHAAALTTGGTWPGISTLTRLRQLGLALRRGAQGLEELRHLPSLTHLNLFSMADSEATAADLAPLARLTQLQHLGVYNFKPQALLPALHMLPALPLRQLILSACTEAGMAALLPSLRAVTYLLCDFDVPHNPEAEWPQQLQLLTQLQELQLWHSQLAAVPPSLPHTLTALSICFHDAPLTGLHRLTSLHQLRSLSLAGGTGPPDRTQAVLEGLPPLRQLVELDLSYCKLQAVPASVAAQTAVTNLQLTRNSLQGGWQHLVPLAHLQELEINVTRPPEELEDDQLLHAIPPAFSRLTALTRLSLVGQCRIQRGWRHLQPLSQLQRLDLSWARLPRMPRGLTALWDLPVRIQVDADDISNGWVQRFNERNAHLLEQHSQQQQRAGIWLRFFWLVLVRLLRRLFGGAATD